MTLFVATLVSNPAAPSLTDALVARAAQALKGFSHSEWLDQDIAADLFFDLSKDGKQFQTPTPALPTGGRENSEPAVSPPPPCGEGLGVGVAATVPVEAHSRQIAQMIRDTLADAPIDVIVQPTATRRKHLFLADMDSTMIGQECIDELADFVGLKERVSGITERAMRGELAFEPALRERVALLQGLDVSVIDTIIANHITLTPGGRKLVMTMRANGAYTALVSGGFTLFTGPVAHMLGFQEHRSNVLIVGDGKLMGQVAEPILGKEAKLASLVEMRERLNLASIDTMAVGDGANDLAMLGEAGIGIAFHAKPTVAAAAHARIDHADLTALLYAQGYRSVDFVR